MPTLQLHGYKKEMKGDPLHKDQGGVIPVAILRAHIKKGNEGTDPAF